MTSLSEKALEILQALDSKPEYFTFDLTSNGFSEAAAVSAIKELEKNGYIFISRTFINGNVAFVLL